MSFRGAAFGRPLSSAGSAQTFGILLVVARAFLLVAVLVASAVAGVAAAGAVAERPRVAVVDETPFTVRGTGFRAAERVRVALRVNGAVHSRTVRSTVRGRFSARFADVIVDGCTIYVVSAIGNKGSRAGLKVVPECPAP